MVDKKALCLVFERRRGGGGVKRGVGGQKSPSVLCLSEGGAVVRLNEGLVGKKAPSVAQTQDGGVVACN